MADPVTGMILVGTAVASTGAKMYAENAAAESRLASLDLTRQQHVLQHQQKTLANFEATQKIIDAQTANATTRGVGLGSASLEAIARNTYDISAKNQKNLDTEESIFEQNIKTEKSNTRSTLYAELFGDAASLASDLATVNSKWPTSSTKPAKE